MGPFQRDLLNQLLPRAAAWASNQERFVLRNARSLTLTLRERDVARRAGVSSSEAVRMLIVPEVSLPDDIDLREAAVLYGLITPGTAGLTIGHGIFLRQDCLHDRKLIAHELKHVAQYEQEGSISEFLERYLFEYIEYGYLNAPLEREAQLFAESC